MKTLADIQKNKTTSVPSKVNDTSMSLIKEGSRGNNVPFFLQKTIQFSSEPSTQFQALEEKGFHQLKSSTGEQDDIYEQKLDRVTDKVMGMPEENKKEDIPQTDKNKNSIQTQKKGSGKTPNVTNAVNRVVNNPGHGQQVEPGIRSRVQSFLGADLSHVKVHQDNNAHEAARSIHAKAFTHKNNIWLRKGQSSNDNRLMTHELAHVVQQGRVQELLQRNPLDDAMDLQSKAYSLTHKGFTQIIPPAKPTNRRKLKRWNKRSDVKNYIKAYQLALKIMSLVPKASNNITMHNDIEARAQMVASDLANAAFVDEAMDIADKIGTNTPAKIKADPKKMAQLQKEDAKLKESIYKPIIGVAHRADKKHLIKVAKFFAASTSNPKKHPLIEELTRGKCETSKKIGWEKVKSILDEILNGYSNKIKLIDPFSKILIFQKHFRQKFSEWMWKKDKTFLFSILNSKWFIEPRYGGTQYSNQKPLSLKKDFPWVYAWKQKYYIKYLIDLCTKAKTKDSSIKIPRDPSLSSKPGVAKRKSFAKVKSWLEKYTENIGKALKVLYPKAPDKIRDVYHKIGDIFFYHVDKGNVTANRFGKLAGLGKGAPGMRMKSDCDVLATYAARLMKSSGFNVLGYILILSCDSKRSHHSGALLKKGTSYYAVSNKMTYVLNAATLPDAKKELHTTTLADAYYKPYPKHFTKYINAGKSGELPANFWPNNIKATCKGLNP